jgi:hypothetical protein
LCRRQASRSWRVTVAGSRRCDGVGRSRRLQHERSPHDLATARTGEEVSTLLEAGERSSTWRFVGLQWFTKS